MQFALCKVLVDAIGGYVRRPHVAQQCPIRNKLGAGGVTDTDCADLVATVEVIVWRQQLRSINLCSSDTGDVIYLCVDIILCGNVVKTVVQISFIVVWGRITGIKNHCIGDFVYNLK